MPVQIPCGRCIGCRLERSRQWAVRLMHENTLHEQSCFLTLTYDDEHLPGDGSLHKDHFQKFMKRLRKYLHDLNVKISRFNEKEGKSFPLVNERIRFFACGEYGEKTNRPHYHALIYGFDPKDKQFYKSTPSGNLWISSTLDRIWGHGFVVCGSVSFDSAAYVARYIMKKQYGEQSGRHYFGPATVDTGELREREFVLMSRRPGIANSWYGAFRQDVFPRDAVLCNSVPSRPPRYYERILEKENPDLAARVRHDRRLRIAHNLNPDDQTPDRLEVRERVRKARTSSLARDF